ncbi:unnamed protein product [Timema podura]|uniref:Ig-like domain-containing protein n=1 Tax=Timema podura TaxID=61482 RepID=A0ABN7NTY4_TIMPD|nr:unnamed protein product [Timema podura]
MSATLVVPPVIVPQSGTEHGGDLLVLTCRSSGVAWETSVTHQVAHPGEGGSRARWRWRSQSLFQAAAAKKISGSLPPFGLLSVVTVRSPVTAVCGLGLNQTSCHEDDNPMIPVAIFVEAGQVRITVFRAETRRADRSSQHSNGGLIPNTLKHHCRYIQQCFLQEKLAGVVGGGGVFDGESEQAPRDRHQLI